MNGYNGFAQEERNWTMRKSTVKVIEVLNVFMIADECNEMTQEMEARGYELKSASTLTDPGYAGDHFVLLHFQETESKSTMRELESQQLT